MRHGLVAQKIRSLGIHKQRSRALELTIPAPGHRLGAVRQGMAVQVLHAAGMLAAAHVVVQVGLAGGGNATGVAEELQKTTGS